MSRFAKLIVAGLVVVGCTNAQGPHTRTSWPPGDATGVVGTDAVVHSTDVPAEDTTATSTTDVAQDAPAAVVDVPPAIGPSTPLHLLLLEPGDLHSNLPQLTPRLVVEQYSPSPLALSADIPPDELAALAAALRLTTLDGKDVPLTTVAHAAKQLPPKVVCNEKPCTKDNTTEEPGDVEPAWVEVVADWQPSQWYRLALRKLPADLGVPAKWAGATGFGFVHGERQPSEQLQQDELAAVRFAAGSLPMTKRFTTCQQEDGKTSSAKLSLSQVVEPVLGSQISVSKDGQPCQGEAVGGATSTFLFYCSSTTGAESTSWKIDLGVSADGKAGISFPSGTSGSVLETVLPTAGAKSPNQPCEYLRF